MLCSWCQSWKPGGQKVLIGWSKNNNCNWSAPAFRILAASQQLGHLQGSHWGPLLVESGGAKQAPTSDINIWLVVAHPWNTILGDHPPKEVLRIQIRSRIFSTQAVSRLQTYLLAHSNRHVFMKSGYWAQKKPSAPAATPAPAPPARSRWTAPRWLRAEYWTWGKGRAVGGRSKNSMNCHEFQWELGNYILNMSSKWSSTVSYCI